MRVFGRFIVALLIIAFATQVNAAQVATRNEVSAILAVDEVVEDFEGDGVPAGQHSTNVGSIDYLNSTWITQPGVSYNAARLYLNDDGYLDLVTRTLGDTYTNRPITFIYDSPTPAMGVDLQDYVGYCSDATVEVFNGSNVSLGTVNVSAEGFFGWEDAGGIGSVTFTKAIGDCYLMLDNHAYATGIVFPTAETKPVPAFSNWALLLLMGLMAGGAFVGVRRLR